MSDQVVSVLTFALESLSQRQQVIASNIANAQTPGYLGQQVSFESSLHQALAAGGTATAVQTPSTLAPGTNGNNVSLSQQLTEMEQATLQTQAVDQLLTDQLRILRGSMGGGFQ